ncbi:MAG: hypothetical protein Kow0010_18390 [Dehalococcoidia bacterium]
MSFDQPSADLANRALATMRSLQRARAERPIARASTVDRFVARLIDLAILGAILFIVTGILANVAADEQLAANPGQPADEYIVHWGVSGLSWELATALAAYVAIVCAYEVGLTAWRGATFGKRRTGIRIVGVDMRPASPRVMLIRTLAWALPLCLAALMWFTSILLAWGPFIIVAIMWFAARRDPQARGLHDHLAGTTVVSEETWRQNVGIAERG